MHLNNRGKIVSSQLFFSEHNCKISPQGQEFLGNISVSASGEACLPWRHFDGVMLIHGTTHDAKNYCRWAKTPKYAATFTRPWCFTREGPELCDVPYCSEQANHPMSNGISDTQDFQSAPWRNILLMLAKWYKRYKHSWFHQYIVSIIAIDEKTCNNKWTYVAGCMQNATQFACVDGQCLPDGLQCDGTKHCEDGSDETQLCRKCHMFMCHLVDCMRLLKRKKNIIFK